MTPWRRWRALWPLGLLLWHALASSAAAQAQPIFRDGDEPPVPFHKQPSSDAIRKLLESPIETKDFQEELTLGQFLERFRDRLPAHAKTLRFVIDQEAFRENMPRDYPAVANTPVKLPPFPRKMALATALRLALSKIPTGDATYWVRRGHIVITTHDQINSADLGERRPPGFWGTTKLGVVLRSYQRQPLSAVLEELSDLTGTAIVLDRRAAAQARTPITAKFQGVSLATALTLATDMAGLRYVAVGNIAYVTTPDNARQVEQYEAARQAAWAWLLEGNAQDGFGTGGFWTQQMTVSDPIRQRPLAGALADLTGEGFGPGFPTVVIDPRVAAQAKTPVTARFPNGATLEAALIVLTDMAGLRHVVLGDAVYVTSPANAAAMDADLARRGAAAKKGKEPAKPFPGGF
jgi:hypothetical protein